MALGQAGALSGDANTAVRLDGADDNVIRNPIAGFPTTAISAELWVKTTDTTKEAGLVSYAASSSADEFQLRDARALRVYVKGARVDTRWKGAVRLRYDRDTVFPNGRSYPCPPAQAPCILPDKASQSRRR